jgi:predicted Rossmann-fold nucleotide-binding protein
VRETRGRSIEVQPLARGGVALPPGLPIDPYRSGLYSVDELYDADEYAATRDARAYAWSLRRPSRDDTLAQALHDHAVDQALTDWISERRLVGVMGGHHIARGDETYAQAARFAHAVGAGLTVATGGGPGAMEAANLGAYLAAQPPAAVDDALALLAAAPGYLPSVDAWVSAAQAVRAAHPVGTASLGIPTWHYGHEPTNLFATSVAKYFRNALREAILVQICSAGIVFLPGRGGTLQEVFQDACENFYADEASVAPMVLVGAAYWTETLPAWPLLLTLARGRPMESHVHLVDSVEEAVALFAATGREASDA